MIGERWVVLGVAPVRANSRLGLYHFAILLPDRAALGRFLAHLVRTGDFAWHCDERKAEKSCSPTRY